jgi:SAM-dependent MidA family methyltransferase
MSGAALWLDSLRQAGARVAVIADYGVIGPTGQVRALKGHEEADPLAEPGSVDLTAHVDWAAVRRTAEGLGFSFALESQESFLLRHGVLEELNRIDRGSVAGASGYLRLRQLLLPTGLGAAFQVARLERA